MNKFCSTILCGLLVAPLAAQAEVKFGGEVVLGYGETDGAGGAYGLVTLNDVDSDGPDALPERIVRVILGYFDRMMP